MNKANILRTIFTTLLICAIGVLMYVLVSETPKHSTQTIAQDSPTLSKPINKSPEVFTDGLGEPDSENIMPLDEFGAGIDNIAVFNRDINNDNMPDRITRTHVATGNAHDYEEYKIELNKNGKFVDITPKGFRTTKGADCILRRIQFDFLPHFSAKIISRPFQDTWDTPSVATKTVYELNDNIMAESGTQKMSSVCDVTELF